MKTIFSALFAAVLVGITGCGLTHTSKSSFDHALATNDPTVVFMGDSITANWPNLSPLFAQHPAFIDAGIVGNDSGEMVDRFAADVVAKHPSQVLILAGTNDVYPESYMLDNNWNTPGNITWMVQTAQQDGIMPILATIPPWGCAAINCSLAAEADPSKAHLTNTASLNAWIKSWGAAQGLIVLDFHSVLVSSDGETYQPALTLDGVHPSAAGYALMDPMVEDAIKANQWK
jgi:lysophospholipase L1-like esterase